MPTPIVDVDAFTDPITRPVDLVDLRSSASLASIYQGLSNRTRNLKNRLDNFATFAHTWTLNQTFSDFVLFNGDTRIGGDEPLYFVGAVNTPRARVSRFSATDMNQIGYTIPSNVVGVGNTNLAVYRLNLTNVLPTGAVVGVVKALVQPGFARTVRSGGPITSGDNGRVYVRTTAWTPNYAAPAFGVQTVTPLAEDNGTTAVQTITTAAAGVIIGKGSGSAVVMLDVVCGFDAVTFPDNISGVEIAWTDPGPRNF